jgi:hypothetical protein
MAHDLARTQRALAAEIRDDTGGEDAVPGTVAEVVAVAERTDGVRLAELLAELQPDTQAVEAVLAEILRTAADPAGGQ